MANAMKLKVELTTGATHDVVAVFADLIRYDIIRARNNFPSREESDFLFMGLVSFAALVRTGVVESGVKVDTFLGTIASIEPQDDEATEGATFPTEHSE